MLLDREGERVMERYGYDEEKSAAENQARAQFEIAAALRSLLYAFKFGKEEGLSVAESIEVAGKAIAGSIESAAQGISTSIEDSK